MWEAAWYIGAAWLSISTIHALLSTLRSTSLAYNNFLNQYGLLLSPGHLKVYWSGCPAWVLRLGSLPGLRVWFDLGSVCSCGLLLLSIPILAGLLINTVQQPTGEQLLKPVIPGVNVPWSQMVYIGLTIFVCAVLHELGHALAAVKEQVRVDGYGVFFLLVYPGAYVDLHEEHMTVISARRRLRIYCAGVWHNFVLACLGAMLFSSTSFMSAPLFAIDRGVYVLNVNEDSALYDQLPVGTHITHISGCPIHSVLDFQLCIDHIYTTDLGYCIPLDVIKKQQRVQQPATVATAGGALPFDCCGDSRSHICFSYESTQMHQGHVCLHARNTTAGHMCRSARHCFKGFGQYVCAKPHLDASSRLLRIAHTLGKDIMFEGNPYLVLHQVRGSNYSPRWPWVSSLKYLPIVFEVTGLYLLSISSALCFLNMVPVYYLDGHWVLLTLIEHFLPPYLPNHRSRTKLTHLLLTTGSLLVLANALVAIADAVI